MPRLTTKLILTLSDDELGKILGTRWANAEWEMRECIARLDAIEECAAKLGEMRELYRARRDVAAARVLKIAAETARAAAMRRSIGRATGGGGKSSRAR